VDDFRAFHIVKIGRGLDIVDFVVFHLFVVDIIYKTNFGVFREYGTFQEIAMGFVCSFAQRFDALMIDSESTNGFGENRIGNVQSQIQIHDYHFDPFRGATRTRVGPYRKIALVIGVYVYSMTLA
jgi:hypothetical protein